MKTDTNAKKVIKCRFCNKVFKRQVQLGGHASKAHPGKSVNYQRKMAIFQKRTHDRETRVKACEWFAEKTGLCFKQHRNVITQIKKDMLAGRAPIIPKRIQMQVEKLKSSKSVAA